MVNLLTLGAKRPAFQFHLLGLPVRVYAHFLVLAVLLGSLAGGFAGMVAGAVVAFLVVLGHELGHAAAEQAFGLRPAIDLVWFGGATSDEGVHALSRLRRIAVAAAGPIAGALVGGLAWRLGVDRTGVAAGAAEVGYQVGVVWGLANLLPIWPMDGGHLLVDLLPGRPEARRRITHVVSLVLAAGVSFVALAIFDYPIFAVFSGGFAYLNYRMLRAGGSAARAEQALRDSFGRLAPATAAEDERRARGVLAEQPHAAVGSAAADLLVASHLVRGDPRRAREELASLTTTWIMPALRDLVVLGDSAGSELDRRLAVDATDHDVRLAALHRSLLGDHGGAAALASSPLGKGLDGQTAHLVQTRAFYAGAFRESIVIGEAAERLPDVQPHIPFNVACGWAKLGDTQAALVALERAAAAGWTDVHDMDADEDLSAVHELATYKQFRKQIASGKPARSHHQDGYRRSGAALGLAGCLAVSAGVVAGVPGAGGPPVDGPEIVALDADTGVVRWRAGMDGASAGVAGGNDLVVVNHYAMTRGIPSGTMTVRDPVDGRVIASVTGLGTGATRTPDGGVLVEVVTRETHSLLAIDATTGEERWTLETEFGDPRVLGDVAVLSSLDAIGLQGVDISSGTVLWSREDLQPLAEPHPDAVLAQSPNGHRIVSLDARTGADRWSAVVDGPAGVLEHHIWIDESASERVLIDVSTGARTTLPVADVAAEPLLELDAQQAVVATGDTIAVVDLASGDVLWQRRSTARHAITLDGALLASSVRGVEAYDPDTGDRLWTLPSRAPVLSTAGRSVLVRSTEELVAVDPRRGTVLWTWDTGSGPTSMVVTGDLVVIARIPGRP
jgi:outer membrane protein assembly factor BamB/Zn-dependent protease